MCETLLQSSFCGAGTAPAVGVTDGGIMAGGAARGDGACSMMTVSQRRQLPWSWRPCVQQVCPRQEGLTACEDKGAGNLPMPSASFLTRMSER
jgi:hypothetical protein